MLDTGMCFVSTSPSFGDRKRDKQIRYAKTWTTLDYKSKYTPVLSTTMYKLHAR